MAQTKRKLRVIGIVIFLLIALGACFCWLIGSGLLAPARRPVVLPVEWRDSEVKFSSRSGATLRGNFLKGRKGAGLVILMHGIRGNRSDMVKHAAFLLEHGSSVLIFDFQAHGESSGKKITSGYLESMDASAAVAFARTNAPGEKVAILGASLGGAAALLAEPPLQVDGMILEMVYPDIQRAVKNRIAIVLGNWARVFSPLLTCQLKWRVGVDAEWFSPQRQIANVRCPKLIIAGAEDRHTTIEDSRALFNAAGEPKDIWIIDQAAHENLYSLTGVEYEHRVLAFLDRCLKSN